MIGPDFSFFDYHVRVVGQILVPGIEQKMSGSRWLRNLRATCCLVWFAMLTTSLTVTGIIVLTFQRDPRKKLRWRNRFVGRWMRAVARLAGMRLKVEGTPPTTPTLLVANHLSYLDIVALSQVMDCAFVSKDDVAGWPLLGLASRHSRTIFIDRQSNRSLRRALIEIRQAVSDGLSVIVFPEGTTTPGEEVTRFRPSLLEFAVEERAPVHFASIHYRTADPDPPARDAVCWWGEMTFVPHFFNLFRLHGFEAEVRFGPEPIRGSDRKALAEELHGAVENLFVPSS